MIRKSPSEGLGGEFRTLPLSGCLGLMLGLGYEAEDCCIPLRHLWFQAWAHL